jgi:hypothetical protein
LEGGFDKIEIDGILVVFHFADDAVVKDAVGGFEVGRLLLVHLLVVVHWYSQKLCDFCDKFLFSVIKLNCC